MIMKVIVKNLRDISKNQKKRKSYDEESSEKRSRNDVNLKIIPNRFNSICAFCSDPAVKYSISCTKCHEERKFEFGQQHICWICTIRPNVIGKFQCEICYPKTINFLSKCCVNNPFKWSPPAKFLVPE